MEESGGVDLPLPTPEDDLPNEFCANVTFFRKMENKICFKIRFPFFARSENSWPFDKFKVYANIVFPVIFQN